jgi:diaminopimelate decarboxylase
MLTVRGGVLWVENCSTVALAEQFGTPLHVVSENQLRRNVQLIRDSFARNWPGGAVRLLPSIKANHALALRRILTEEGTGCDTFGHSELQVALSGRVPADLISVNGSAKDAKMIEAAVIAGARLTLDSEAELDTVIEAASRLGKRAKIRLRLRPDYTGLDTPSDLVPGRSIRDAAQGYKPGIAAETAVRLGAIAISRPEIEFRGLMVHLGRHSPQTAVWRSMAASFADLVVRLTREWGDWRPLELDIGGGFPASRDPTSPLRQPPPPIGDLAAAITVTLSESLRRGGLDPREICLEVEPGRSLFADAGLHLTRIRHIKSQTHPVRRCWIETDTTEMFLPDLLIEHAHFTPVFCQDRQGGSSQPCDIVGISCGFDVLAEQVTASDVAVGEVIAFLDTGAYQDAASANFNAMPRPGTVLVKNDEAEWIKRPETIADVFARDIIPKRIA